MMLPRTEQNIISLIEGKLESLSYGELQAHIIREEIESITLSFEYKHDEHGALAAPTLGSNGAVPSITPVYKIKFVEKK